MKISQIFLFLASVTLLEVKGDGQRDYGEACSLRSQIANYFRQNDSEQGCMSEKGLVCVSHKCVCDPTSTYVQPTPSSGSSKSGGVRTSIANFFLKKMLGRSDSSTVAPPTASPTGTVNVGRCVGRAGSPCLTENAVCVEHAACQGSPKICRCQGIYGSTTKGLCSKRARLANEALKRITSGFTG